MKGKSQQLIAAAQELAEQVAGLKFELPVTHVYNPLAYAWAAHEEYLRRFGDARKRVVFLGMNPGPFGMVQTGVPFGEVAAVRDWMKINASIKKPAVENPRRPVTGFACTRSEVSGRRLWGLFAERFDTPEKFFAEHFVVNYCPLAFCEASGLNRTPDKLRPDEREQLFQFCDAHLHRVMETLESDWLIGVGGFAEAKAQEVTQGTSTRVGCILHPSPASPAANRGWAQAATKQLTELGLWK